MQLHFQCDADLGDNRDYDHSQTSYLGYLAGNFICWCSTDQGSISTSTAESEINAVNHILNAEVIASNNDLRITVVLILNTTSQSAVIFSHSHDVTVLCCAVSE